MLSVGVLWSLCAMFVVSIIAHFPGQHRHGQDDGAARVAVGPVRGLAVSSPVLEFLQNLDV